MEWIKYDQGKSIGLPGIKDGKIVQDEEYKRSCRIMREELADGNFLITWGVYDAEMHSTRATALDVVGKYEKMKKELADFIDRETDLDEEYQFYDHMMDAY